MTSKQHFQMQWQGIEIEVHYCSNWSESFEQIYGYPMAYLEVERRGRQPLPFRGATIIGTKTYDKTRKVKVNHLR